MNTKALDFAHPLVRDWFCDKVGVPTEPQVLGWPAISAGQSTLISAPTGSGKTFAAFLACLSTLVDKAVSGTLPDATEVLYVSPLKALSNDIHKNLTQPLQEIASLAKARGVEMTEIRVAVRTGDTETKERTAMLKKPPHILVTTPESLYILLTAEKSRVMLSTVKTVIVDEIHALADDKRGAHLTLSLERLEALTDTPPIRIGLSATQKPLERVAAFLVGADRPLPTLINIGHGRHLDLGVEVPSSELAPIASNEMWDEIYDRVAQLVSENRSTLVFVNTRRLAERVAHHLAERIGSENVAAHHGSLSRKIRLAAENKLKNGELKVLVATASLELGIDIGTVDLVCQLGSPRSIAVALQRIGRAGHWYGAVSKGRIFATTRDELVECSALVYAIKTGDLDQLIIPDEPIDILSQQIIAACATSDWHEDDLYQLVKRAYPYRNLTRHTFNQLLTMLTEGNAGSRGRYSAYLFHDQVNKQVKARRGSRLIAITSGGAIPDNGLFTVVAEPNGVTVGTLDEDFAVESNRGDIILLGNTSWQINRVESTAGKVLVEDAHGAPPSVPFWRGEAPARTAELSLQVAALRQKISDMLPASIISLDHSQPQPEMLKCIAWLQEHCGLDQSGAEQLIEYIITGRSILGAVPTQQTIIAERFFDEGGGMQLVIHAPFGARINKAWGLALRKCFCRSFNFELQAAATDDGLNISLAEQHSFPLADVFKFLHPNTLTKVLTQAVLQSPLFATRWRWDAGRALALVRFRNGRKVPPNIMRMRADDLLAAVFPDAAACQDNLAGKDIQLPDHPLVNEAIKDALHEAMDLDGLMNLLSHILDGSVQCLAVDTPTPSAFSHEIINANPYAYLDDAPLEERRARAVSMRRILPKQLMQEVGILDQAVIAEVEQQAWPDIRNADELHDSLQTFIALPIHADLVADKITQDWQTYFQQLQSTKRAAAARVADQTFWVAAEKQQSFSVLYPNAEWLEVLPQLNAPQLSYDEILLALLRGWFFNLGPVTAADLQQLFHLPLADIETALLKLESSGLILRGQFKTSGEAIEWCERRLLSRIHRLTVGKLRKEIEPVTAAQFMRWLLQWQHVEPNNSLVGEHGLLEIIKQLQGFELPAKFWEKKIFAKRMKHYESYLLDQLCLTGIVGWGRISAHAKIQSGEEPSKKITPTSIAPITFFIREDMAWLPPKTNMEVLLSHLSHIASDIYHYLKQRGASFMIDIVQGTHHLKSEVETGLWELVAAGLVTADSFDNLRALIDPKRRLRKRRRGVRSPLSRGSRWSLLNTDLMEDTSHHLESICWVLLKRYGVVFRDLLVREKIVPRWRDLLIAFRRLEDQGEIRGGRFVSGFLGEQFALPYVVDSLRAMRKEAAQTGFNTIAASDPLNLVGIILPGSRITASSTQTILLKDGEQVEIPDKRGPVD